MKLLGIGASSGVAVAKAFVIKESQINVQRSKTGNKAKAVTAVRAAIKKAINEINIVKAKASRNLADAELAVFDAHITLASDPALSDKIIATIEKKALNELAATSDAIDFFATMFKNMDDPYMKERAADIKDVGKRILKIMAGVESCDLASIDQEVIIVADDLTPSETALLNKNFVKGFITNVGGKTSHAAIMARSMEIPAVLGLKVATDKIINGDLIALDGDWGIVIINPSSKDQVLFQQKAASYRQELVINARFRGKKTLTSDGKQVELVANIGSLNDLDAVRNNDAEGIGLFRSEFLYMNETNWPSEQRQFEVYMKVLETMKNKLVVVRTLDIGGDKTLKYYHFPSEMNPFLGYRAIRMCLDKPHIFKTQLRALLRASVHGQLAIMFPMIATIPEFLEAKALLETCKQELRNEKTMFATNVAVGMMMEVPGAAVLADQFAEHADFFSIGTNDLMQYTMAADRMNERVSYLYQPLNPAVLNMISMIIQGAHKHKKWVGMCGEMAGDTSVIPLLIGFGLDEFSMTAASILNVRRLISKIDSKQAAKMAAKALTLHTETEVQKLVQTAFRHLM